MKYANSNKTNIATADNYIIIFNYNYNNYAHNLASVINNLAITYAYSGCEKLIVGSKQEVVNDKTEVY